MNIEEGKTLNHLIHIEEWIMRLLKSLEDQGDISGEKKKKKKKDLYPSGSKPGVLYGLAKMQYFKVEHHPFA